LLLQQNHINLSIRTTLEALLAAVASQRRQLDSMTRLPAEVSELRAELNRRLPHVASRPSAEPTADGATTGAGGSRVFTPLELAIVLPLSPYQIEPAALAGATRKRFQSYVPLFAPAHDVLD